MRRLKMLMLLVTFAFSAFVQAQVDDCSDSSKGLYKDIQIYRATEKISPANGTVKPRLQYDLNLLISSNLTLAEKVQSLEAGFAKCNINLTSEEQLLLQDEINDSVAEVKESL